MSFTNLTGLPCVELNSVKRWTKSNRWCSNTLTRDLACYLMWLRDALFLEISEALKDTGLGVRRKKGKSFIWI